MNEDRKIHGTVAVETNQEPITIESMWKLYTEERLIPMTFKPTGETVYVTLQFRDWIERYKNEYRAKEQAL